MARGLVFAANQDPALARVFTTYSANTPQLYLDIDREKVQTLGIEVVRCLQCAAVGARQRLSSTTSTCSAEPGRSTSRARRPSARSIDDIYRINVRNRKGEMVPVRAFAEARLDPRAAIGHPLQQLSQRRRSTAGRRRATRSGEALAAMERLSADDAAARLRLRMDRHRAAGEGGGRQDHDDPRRWRVLFAYLFLVGAVRELDDPGPGAAVGVGRRARRDGWRC